MNFVPFPVSADGRSRAHGREAAATEARNTHRTYRFRKGRELAQLPPKLLKS